MSVNIDLLLQLYGNSLTWLQDAVKDIPDERMADQPAGIRNHPAWHLSHLACANGMLLGLLDEPDAAELAKDMQPFAPGSQPSPDRATYQSKDELMRLLQELHRHTDAAIRAKHESYFSRATPEFLRDFAPDIGSIAVYLLAAHESYHMAQLMQWKSGLARAAQQT